VSAGKIPVILLADDEAAHRLLLRLDLEASGYKIVEAIDGREAVELYQAHLPDVVLLDIQMPEMDGLTACRTIRTLPKGATLPILMITVLDDREMIDRTFEAGATDYVTKPVNFAILRQRVRRLLTAQRADRLREELARILVHDMKTPLTAIQLGSELMIDEQSSDPEILELIRNNTLQLLNMVMGILDASRLRDGQLTLQRSRRDVCACLREMQTSFAWMKVTRRVTCSVEGCVPGVDAWLDWTLIERVLINLITNAFKNSVEGGTIRLSSEIKGPFLYISVSDQGRGIAPDDQKRLFETATPLNERKTNRSVFDTGLGLSFCKLAVEAHGGTIEIESEVGRGARFTLALPLIDALIEVGLLG